MGARKSPVPGTPNSRRRDSSEGLRIKTPGGSFQVVGGGNVSRRRCVCGGGGGGVILGG